MLLYGNGIVMKEVTSTFTDGLNVGLSPALSLYTQTPCLHNCYNVVPTKEYLQGREDVYVFSREFSTPMDFPKAVGMHLGRHSLVFYGRDLYKLEGEDEFVNLGSGDWEDIPHVADFLEYVVFSTPQGQWHYSTKRGLERYDQAIFQTCCNFRGQLIVGNCDLPRGPLKTGHWIENLTNVGGSNVVAWTRIGSLDWVYGLDNEVGWAEMPWSGEILRVLPFGSEVVVYGDNGVVKMKPVDSPTVTFAISDYGDIGVLNRNCVAGDGFAHVFLGSDYNLYQIVPERALSEDGMKPKQLGYREFMKQLKDPIMSFDPSLRHWWVGDKDRCFILTEQGLGEASITPTSLSRRDGYLWGFCAEHGSDYAFVETSPLSLGGRGIKTLMAIESDVQASGDLYGSVRYRYQTNQDFEVLPSIPLDPRGGFFPVVSGTEFKVGLVATDFRQFLISKLWFHHKNTDKTFSRGGMNVGRPAE